MISSKERLFVPATDLWLGALFTANTILFVLALHSTSAANVLFIAATMPFHAAWMSWVLLGETIRLSTLVALLVAFGGILMLVWDGLNAGTFVGNLQALGASLMMAAAMVKARSARRHGFAAPLTGGLLCALVVAPFGARFAFNGSEALYLAIDGALVMPIALSLLFIGPKYLSAVHVGLFLLLDPILGPFWIWLALDETPPPLVAVAGAIIVATLLLHSLSILYERKNASRW